MSRHTLPHQCSPQIVVSPAQSPFSPQMATQARQDISKPNPRYALEILERADMASCKPVATLVDTNAKLSVDSGPSVYLIPRTHYRSLVGAFSSQVSVQFNSNILSSIQFSPKK